MTAPKPPEPSRTPVKVPRALRELLWLYNAWLGILLVVVGSLCLYQGKGAWTGFYCVLFGLLNGFLAWLGRADSPWSAHRDF